MNVIVSFALAARRDLAEIFAHYRSVAPHVISGLERDIDRVMMQIAQFPESYQQHATGVRRAHLRVFLYTFYYRVQKDCAEIAAVLPQKSHPSYIDARIQH